MATVLDRLLRINLAPNEPALPHHEFTSFLAEYRRDTGPGGPTWGFNRSQWEGQMESAFALDFSGGGGAGTPLAQVRDFLDVLDSGITREEIEDVLLLAAMDRQDGSGKGAGKTAVKNRLGLTED